MLSLCWLLYFSADCGRQHTSNMPIATNWSHYSNCLSGTQDSPICSDHSDQMSKCERFAQIAQDKWATVSESLRSLIENEQLWAICSGCSWWISKSLAYMSESLIRPFAHKKWAIRSKKFDWNSKKKKKKNCDLLIPSFLMSNVSESLRSLTKNEQCE